MIKIKFLDIRKTILIDKNNISIGREDDNDIIIDHFTVSRYHCSIFLKNNKTFIKDNDSTNGVIINSNKLSEPYILTSSEYIQIGEIIIHISFVESGDFILSQISELPVRIELSIKTKSFKELMFEQNKNKADVFKSFKREISSIEDFYSSEIPDLLKKESIIGFGIVVENKNNPFINFIYGKSISQLFNTKILNEEAFKSEIVFDTSEDIIYSAPFKINGQLLYMYIISTVNKDIKDEYYQEFISNMITISKILYLLKNSKIQYDNQKKIRKSQSSVISLPGHKQKYLFISDKMKDLKEYVMELAKSNGNVIIEGETGVGKEIIASMVHHFSDKNGKYIPIITSSISETIIECELFGHKKGAFTGAIDNKKGLFLEADKGTIFLDEVADMSLSVQTRLLRVLDNNDIIPVGSATPINVDLRFIAASNIPFKNLLDDKRLRSDVFFRLNTFRVKIPPLRERRDEIIPLFSNFIIRFCNKLNISYNGITPKASIKLLNYDWPGNIRELKNEAEKIATLIGDDGVVDKSMISVNILEMDKFHLKDIENTDNMKLTIKDFEKKKIIEVLKKTNYNKSKTAKILNLSRKGLQNKIDRYGIEIGCKLKKF